jgi:hypothetical protein
MSDPFAYSVRELPEDGNVRKSILAALHSSPISSEDELKVIILGMTRAEVTSLFQEPPLSLGLYYASALAGLLVSGR